jgi:ankyrin repeat protein
LFAELLTWKFHAQGPWYLWIDGYVRERLNVNAQDGNGKTPLHYAVTAQQDRSQKVNKLLQNGADLTVQDFNGSTPVDVARQTGDIGTFTLLLRSWLGNREGSSQSDSNGNYP